MWVSKSGAGEQLAMLETPARWRPRPSDKPLRVTSNLISITLSGMTLSARNRLEGEVVELQLGGVMAHVVVRVGENLVESVITKRSVEEMKLKIGAKVAAVIKSTEVMLQKD